MENSKQLSAWSMRLPACRISESVQQLMELALDTLCEAVGSSTQRSVTVLRELTVFCVDVCLSPDNNPSVLFYNEKSKTVP